MGTEAGYENYTDEDLKNKNADNKNEPTRQPMALAVPTHLRKLKSR